MDGFTPWESGPRWAALSPRDAIIALVCGYPADVRKDRWLALYVSHVDESDKGGPLFTVGGLTAKADQWMILADRWAAALAAPPVIKHFHLSDKQGLSEQEHWKKSRGSLRF